MTDLKISNIITKMQEIKEKHGDLVVVSCDESGIGVKYYGIYEPHIVFAHQRDNMGMYPLRTMNENEDPKKHIKLCSLDCVY